MASLARADLAFIEQRRAQRRTGLFLLPAALALVALVWVGLLVWAPLLLNPRHVLGAIEQHALEAGTLTLYAVAATLLANTVLLLLVVLLVALMRCAYMERRLLRIVQVAQSSAMTTTSRDTGA